MKLNCKNCIFVNEKQIDYIELIKIKSRIRYQIVFIDKSTLLLHKNIKVKCKIKCIECNNLTERLFHKSLLTTQYLCRHCRVKGERNPFYGEKLLDHMSQEKFNLMCQHMKQNAPRGPNNHMYGKKLQDFLTPEQELEWRRKLKIATSGERNGMYGKKMKDLMSENDIILMKQHHKESYAKYLKEHKEEYHQRQHEAAERQKNENPEYYHLIKHNAGDASNKKKKYQKTKPEIIVENWLKNHNIEYKYSCIFGGKDNAYQFDFLIRHRKILIEVHGDYWYGNPKYYNIDGSNNMKKLNEIQILKQKRDKEKHDYAISKGFIVLYIWEDEINNSNFKILEKHLL